MVSQPRPWLPSCTLVTNLPAIPPRRHAGACPRGIGEDPHTDVNPHLLVAATPIYAIPPPPDFRQLHARAVGATAFAMHSGTPTEYVSLERLERALAVMAYIVLRHGAVYAPILERLEREVEAARRDDPISRAKHILDRYTKAGGRNAMRVSQSCFCSSDGPKP